MYDTLLVRIAEESTEGTWGSIVQSIGEEMHRESPEDLDIIKRLICSCIRFYRTHKFSFVDGTGYIWLLEDQGEYPVGEETYNGDQYDGETDDTSPPLPDSLSGTIPRDIIQVKSIKVRGENEDWFTETLEKHDIEIVRHWRRTRNHRSTPRMFSLYGSGMEFFPTPNRNFLAKVDYHRDVGTPYYSYTSSGGYTFYQPFTSTIISDSYKSIWFSEGELLVRAWVKRYLYANYLNDKKMAQSMAAEVSIAYGSLTKAASKKQSHSQRTPVRV